MKASDLRVKCLESEGIEYVFGVPGEEIQLLSLGVQSGFVPGQDARNPVAEQGAEAVLPTDVLRDPPLKPGGN